MEPPTRYIDGNSPVITVNMKPQLLLMAALVVSATAQRKYIRSDGQEVLRSGDLTMNVRVSKDEYAHLRVWWQLDNNSFTEIEDNFTAPQRTLRLDDKTYSDLQFRLFESNREDWPIVLLSFEETGFTVSSAEGYLA
ncbi:uncharacterized protein [Panulirus ornatus]|uniref:uncharacterized protein n=1 Tax=Panulirus ornatus TaxID=150431 RepID=UPI003A8941D1